MNPETTSRGQLGDRKTRRMLLGSRGSELALVQARMVAEALRHKCGIEVQTEIISASGDESRQARDRAGGRKGLFTAELEHALIEREIDLAVHSAKDLPSVLQDGTQIVATLTRGPVEDLLITKTSLSFEQLPERAAIATGSIRRERQLRWLRPDLNMENLRGNVPTRLRKFAANNWDAIILARAGLQRLGFSFPEFEFSGAKFFARILPVDQFTPAAGQGVIAIQTRVDSAINEPISLMDDHDTHLCLRAEREFLRLLQGDCDLPIGVLANIVEGEIKLRAQFFGEALHPKLVQSSGSSPEKVAADAFSRLNVS